jgi:ketosteroid isomerase-like protein
MRFPGTRIAIALLAMTAAFTAASAPNPELQVRDAERAFAKTMADRDHDAFRRFLSEEAIFFGPEGAIRGAAAVAEAWKPFFAGPRAPFSWEPEIVEVLDSGKLALSSGPVRAPDGRTVATFNSIWRLEPDSSWRVVFDKGCDAVPTGPEPADGGD